MRVGAEPPSQGSNGALHVFNPASRQAVQAAERQAAGRLFLARELRDVQDVGERLLAGAAQHDADVRAGRVEQRLDGLGDRTVVAAPVQLLEQMEALGDRLQVTEIRGSRIADRRSRSSCWWRRSDDPRPEMRNGWKPPKRCFHSSSSSSPTAKRAPRSAANTAELVVRPFDRGQRRADGLHLLAVEEGLAADEDVAHTARLERPHIGLRHVVAEAEEAAEQDADVARLHRAALHFPAALVHDPRDERADGIRQRLFDFFTAEMLRSPYGSGTGSATTAGCPLTSGRWRASAT